MARRRITIQVQLVMNTLATEPAGLTGYQIGTRTGLNRPTVYRMLDRLVQDGWVTAQPVEGTTSKVMNLTDLGRSKAEEVRNRPAHARQFVPRG